MKTNVKFSSPCHCSRVERAYSSVGLSVNTGYVSRRTSQEQAPAYPIPCYTTIRIVPQNFVVLFYFTTILYYTIIPYYNNDIVWGCYQTRSRNKFSQKGYTLTYHQLLTCRWLYNWPCVSPEAPTNVDVILKSIIIAMLFEVNANCK